MPARRSWPTITEMTTSDSAASGAQHRGVGSKATDLWRTMSRTKFAAIVLLEALVWISYRRRRLRWQAQGAFARWERNVTQPRVKRASNVQPR